MHLRCVSIGDGLLLRAGILLTSLESDLILLCRLIKSDFALKRCLKILRVEGITSEGTLVSGLRLFALILLVTLAYSSATMSDHQIKQKGVANYVGRVKEPRRQERRHSSFYIGLHGRSWVESLEFFAQETAEKTAIKPPQALQLSTRPKGGTACQVCCLAFLVAPAAPKQLAKTVRFR